MIEVLNLNKKFRDAQTELLSDIDFSVAEGSSLAIIGPSGCGKTTLLYILAGLMLPSAGSVTLKGRELKGPSREIAFILQDFGLLPWKRVWQNIALGLKIRGISKREQKQTADRLIEEFGLLEQRNSFPASLSGGEKQRVAIARALALEPSILLMDEPFSSLDTLTREKLQDMIMTIRQEKQLTMLIVTHNIEEAVFIGKDIMILGQRPASIQAMISNPEAGSPSYRNQNSFFQKCRAVRNVVEAL